MSVYDTLMAIKDAYTEKLEEDNKLANELIDSARKTALWIEGTMAGDKKNLEILQQWFINLQESLKSFKTREENIKAIEDKEV